MRCQFSSAIASTAVLTCLMLRTPIADGEYGEVPLTPIEAILSDAL